MKEFALDKNSAFHIDHPWSLSNSNANSTPCFFLDLLVLRTFEEPPATGNYGLFEQPPATGMKEYV